MDKANVFRSGEFFMDSGDILHMLFLSETGVTMDVDLWSADTTTETIPDAPVLLEAIDISYFSFTINWSFFENTSGYYLDVATDSAFTAMVAGYNSLDIGRVDTYNITGLTDGITYYCRIRAYSDTQVSANSNTVTCKTIYDFNDWFLPSRDEIVEMYNELIAHGVGGFAYAYYFSSSERNATEAWAVLRTDGSILNLSKGSSSSARPCREFVSADSYSLRDVGPAGGLIFYKNGTTYLEASPSDSDVPHLAAWSNIINAAIGTTATAIGTGQANTTAIIGQGGHIFSDAKSCNDLVIIY